MFSIDFSAGTTTLILREVVQEVLLTGYLTKYRTPDPEAVGLQQVCFWTEFRQCSKSEAF
ncbi:hypothetical protein D3C85_1237750 [compost metagenome]